MPTNTYVDADYIVPDEEGPLSHARSQVRCHQTGSPEVVSVCHHSGVFLSRAAEAKPAFYQDPSLEFDSLLPGPEARAAHSEAYKHYLPFSPLKVLIVPGISALAVGVIGLLTFLSNIAQSSALERLIRAFKLLPSSEALLLISPLVASIWDGSILPVVMIMIGLCLSIVGLSKERIFRFASMKQSGALGYIPLLGEAYHISIAENFNLDMKLPPNGDNYIIHKGPQEDEEKPHGKISLQIYLTGEEIKKARESYHKKGAKYGFEAINNFRLGWIAVESSPYIRPNLGERALCLEGPLKDHDGTMWHEAISHEYEILPEAIFTPVYAPKDDTDTPEEIKRMPLWVRPVLDDLSGGHILRLEFDVSNKPDYLQNWRYQRLDRREISGDTFLQALSRSKLRHLSLKVGSDAFPSHIIHPIIESQGRISKNRDEVEWRDKSIAYLLDADKNSPNYPLRVTFAAPLTELQAPLVISYELLVKASISGVNVNPDHFWLPNGRRPAEHKPTVESITRFQGTLTVEPGLFAFQLEETSSETISNAVGIPITSEVVAGQLVPTLEKAQIYVKSVVKSAPTTESQGELAYQKRSWNILGRFYTRDKHPIDVYILLISRTPLTVLGETTTWGNITCRALQMSRSKDIQEEMKGKAAYLKDSVTGIIQPRTIPPYHRKPVARMLTQDST